MNKTIKINYLILFVILFFIITCNIYYYDDVFRSYWGYYGWSEDGRPFADLFYKSFIFFRSESIPDIYPLPLVLTSVLLVISLTKALQNILSKDGVIVNITFAIFMLNPFLLSNMLFRYDGAFMILSIALSAIPFIFTKSRTFAISSLLCLTISLGLYQASINVYIGLASVVVAMEALKGEKFTSIASRVLLSVTCVVSSYIIYSKLILESLSLNNNFSKYTQIVELNKVGVINVYENIINAVRKIDVALHSGIGVPLYIFLSIIAISSVFFAIKRKKFQLLFFIAISIFGCFFSSFGVSVFGKSPVFVSRIFIGFGVFIMALPLIGSVILNWRINYLLSLFIAIPMLSIFFATINASREEFKFQNNLSLQMINDINNSKAKYLDFIVIDGYAKNSSVASINKKIFPVISDILPPIFTNRYDGGVFTLMRNGLKDVVSAEPSAADKAVSISDNGNLISDNNIYSIHATKDIIVIKLK
ncbi:glucosyltransferase domain-containing protein [Escherichia coli]|nr:glucosyl transferase GtrII family protein [Escherichia coli]HDL0251425.1 glucosyltransferase domain-containing protein [Escherichia coli]